MFIKFGEKQLNLLRQIKPVYKYFSTLLSGFNIHTGIMFAFLLILFLNYHWKLLKQNHREETVPSW